MKEAPGEVPRKFLAHGLRSSSLFIVVGAVPKPTPSQNPVISLPLTMSVVNWKSDPFDVYVGRHVPDGPAQVPPEKCIYGNTFVLHDVDDTEGRVQVVRNYERWLLAPEQRELVAKVKNELPGKVLGCWCKPKICHGDVLLRTASESSEETEKRRR